MLKAANWDLSVNRLLYCYCPLLNPVIAALPLNVTSSIVKFKVHFHFLNVYNIVKVKINSHFCIHIQSHFSREEQEYLPISLMFRDQNGEYKSDF